MNRGPRPLFFRTRIVQVDRAEPRTIQIIVHGDVQGVGFRWFACRAAEQLGVAGTVANQRDGTVRVVARARPEVLERLRGVLHQGPPYATVTHLEVIELPEGFSGSGFSIVH
jgi:acylphosphatase